MTHQSFNVTLRSGGGDMKAAWFLRQVNLYLLNSALKKKKNLYHPVKRSPVESSCRALHFCRPVCYFYSEFPKKYGKHAHQ